MASTTANIEELAINTIRTLSMDAVQAANSGHPGTPMALAPVTYSLWNDHLNYDPADPTWVARDRFVLSCGHASMLLYSILHLAGVKNVDKQGCLVDAPAITLDDIKNFRQMGSPCAGHPEFGDAGGIETTTGPLGQGIGNSVGMAAAAKWFASRYNREGFDLFDYDVYALCSDGDVMEGVGCEAASLAGHLGLANLCWIYDDNKITIEGNTDLSFSEDTVKRFEGMGWHTVTVDDANDLQAISQAIESFKQTTDKPTIIVLRSIIGFGSPNKANTHGAHGAPLGEEEIRLTKEVYGWPADEQFRVPEDVTDHFAQGVGARGATARADWETRWQAYRAEHPAAATELQQIWNRELPENWDQDIPVFEADAKGLATRASSGQVLNAVAKQIPWLVGGSADLAPSNNTALKFDDAGDHGPDNPGGRNMHFGIREHGMAAMLNGMSLSKLRPFGGTFFCFTDYMRPSMRLASIMHQPVLYILTHDSIGLGEDGPTHQPVEHLAACRAIPGLYVMRPGDANEVAGSYRTLVGMSDHPTALVLTRQGLPTLDREKYSPASGVSRGGYILADCAGDPEVILIGTGSELAICVEAHEHLVASGVRSRLVSLPCFELFDEQDAGYRNEVLPPSVKARVGCEAAIRLGWDRYLGVDGRFVGMDSFGASAPIKELYTHFGITAENVAEQARQAIQDAGA